MNGKHVTILSATAVVVLAVIGSATFLANQGVLPAASVESLLVLILGSLGVVGGAHAGGAVANGNGNGNGHAPAGLASEAVAGAEKAAESATAAAVRVLGPVDLPVGNGGGNG